MVNSPYKIKQRRSGVKRFGDKGGRIMIEGCFMNENSNYLCKRIKMIHNQRSEMEEFDDE